MHPAGSWDEVGAMCVRPGTNLRVAVMIGVDGAAASKQQQTSEEQANQQHGDRR